MEYDKTITIRIPKHISWSTANEFYCHLKGLGKLLTGSDDVLLVQFEDGYNAFGGKKPHTN